MAQHSFRRKESMTELQFSDQTYFKIRIKIPVTSLFLSTGFIVQVLLVAVKVSFLLQ